MYEYWLGLARQAVYCWLRLSKSLRVTKDVRLLIANLIWEERAEWSERFAFSGSK